MADHRLWLFAAARWLLRAPERPHAAGAAPGAWRDPSRTPPRRWRRQARAPESRQRPDSTWRLCHSSARRRRGCGGARCPARDGAARWYQWVRAWPVGDAHGTARSLAADGRAGCAVQAWMARRRSAPWPCARATWSRRRAGRSPQWRLLERPACGTSRCDAARLHPAWRWDSARRPLGAERRPVQPRLTRRAGSASSPGRAYLLAGGAARATAAVVRGSGALSPTRGLEAPLRLAFRASARTEPARGVAEGAERGLYLLDDPSGAVSDRGGSTIQAPLPLARLWACLYLAVRARVGSGRGSPSVLLFLC